MQRRFRDSPFLAHQARPAFDPYPHDYSPPRSHVAGGLHPAVPTHDGGRTSGRNEDASWHCSFNEKINGKMHSSFLPPEESLR